MNKNIKIFLKKRYLLGFSTRLQSNYFPKGISSYLIHLLSKYKKEVSYILFFRLKAYQFWKKKEHPKWSSLKIAEIDYKNLLFFSKPRQKDILKLDKTFQKLGVEQKKMLSIDMVFDSVSIKNQSTTKLKKLGIIFCSLAYASKYYLDLIKKNLGSVVSYNDNFFASLNSSVFTDGSFCYIPQKIECPIFLSTYFRINNKEAGQFERTLIIVEKQGVINYFEGCSAIRSEKEQLHAAVVELIAHDMAIINYSTLQNWYNGNIKGKGGVYNFVTKRGHCIGTNSSINWTQVETGSNITWKYPSCILSGNSSKGTFSSISLTKFYQQADTGTKMVHLGKHTKSKIIAKSISSDNSKNVYRGLIKIASTANFSKSNSQCDSLLFGKYSLTGAYPYFDIRNAMIKVEHEAIISKINEQQLFYLNQRGLTKLKAIALMLTGFCKDVFELLPLEFASEAQNLLDITI